MDKRFDINEFVKVETEQSITADLVNRFKKRRKELKISQKNLAIKSSVSYASIRRFESCGDISLSSFIKIGHAIECLSDFNELFKTQKIQNLRDFKNDK